MSKYNVKSISHTLDWYDWKNAVEINKTEIDSWIQSCVNEVEKSINEGKFPAFHYIISGDTTVFAISFEDSNGEIDVKVIKNRFSTTIRPESGE